MVDITDLSNRRTRRPESRRWRSILGVSSREEHQTPDGVDTLLDALAEVIGVDNEVEASASRLGPPPNPAPSLADRVGESRESALFPQAPVALVRLRWTDDDGSVDVDDLVSALGLMRAWDVEEFLQLDLVDPPGDQHVYRVGFMLRTGELDRHGFAEHWLRQHAPLVVSRGPRFFRYVANIVLSEDDGLVDGVVEQAFSSVEVWAKHDREILEDKPDVRADLRRFIGENLQYAASPWLPIVTRGRGE